MPIRSLLVTATICLSISAPVSAIPKPIAPAAAPFRLGNARFFALRDMTNVVPNDGKTFGVGVDTKAVAAVLEEAQAPTDKITLGVDALLVEMAGRVILVDTGLGPKVGGVLVESLAAAGVTPNRVTDVLITHSHPDHIGGLMSSDGKLAFPNAAIRMTTTEWAYLQSHGEAGMVLSIRAKVQPFQPGAIVLPGVQSVALIGHTPGHTGYEIRSGEERLLDIGDTAHSAIVSLARPDWIIGYDGDASEGRKNREQELARLAASHERIFAPHFPYPGVGYVVRAKSGYRWQPALP